MKIEKFVFAAFMLMASIPAFAQEENGFKKFNVREDFTENGFQWFHDAELLAAGDKEKSNAMTIGWGGHSPDCLCRREALYQGVYG